MISRYPAAARAALAAGVLLTLAKTSNTYWPLLWVPMLMAFTVRRPSWRAGLGPGLLALFVPNRSAVARPSASMAATWCYSASRRIGSAA